MRNIIVVAGLGALVASAGAFVASDAAKAQQCGTYIIAGCFTKRADAQAQRRRIGAPIVIHTNDFPNFRNGFYCAADGPHDSGWQEELNYCQNRSDGKAVPDAYAKSAC